MTTYLVSYQETKTRTRVVEAPDPYSAIWATHHSIVDSYDSHGEVSHFNTRLCVDGSKPSLITCQSSFDHDWQMAIVRRIIEQD